MNQKDLKKEIDGKSLKNFYIFCSDDYFLKKLYFERIKEAKECDADIIDIEDETEIDKIRQHTNTKTLFGSSEYRIVYARIHYILNNINIKNNTDNILILDPVECKNIKHKNLVKFEKPTAEEIKRFIAYRMNIEEKKIEKKAMEFILARFKDKDTSSLNIFMDKAVLYCADKSLVEYDDVVNLTDDKPDAKVFSLFGYIMNKDKKNFFASLDILMQSIHPSVIISILSSETIKALALYYLREDELKTANISGNFSHRYKTYFENFGAGGIQKLLDILYDMDFMLKSMNVNGFSELFKARMFEWFSSS